MVTVAVVVFVGSGWWWPVDATKVRDGSGGGGGGGGKRFRGNQKGADATGAQLLTVRSGQPELALNVGMLVPKTNFGVRGYYRAINDAMREISKANKKNHTIRYSKMYDFGSQNVRSLMMSLTPSPTGQ